MSHGYASELAALVYACAVNRGVDFRLGTSGIFDITFKFKPPAEPDEWITLFLHVQHKEHACLTKEMLTSPRGPFSLRKYFEYYQEIKEMCASSRQKTENGRFMIFTDAKAHPELEAGRSRLRTPLDFWNPDSDGALHFDPDGDSDKERALQQCLADCGQDGRDFLHQFYLYCNQPSARDLEGFIRGELSRMRMRDGNFSNFGIDRIYDSFLEVFRARLEERNTILDKDSNLFEDALSLCLLKASSAQASEAFCLEARFNEVAASHLKECLGGKTTLVLIESSERSSRLTITKLLQATGGCWLITVQGLLKNHEALTEARWRLLPRKKPLVICVNDDGLSDEELFYRVLGDLGKISVESGLTLVIVASEDALPAEKFERLRKVSLSINDEFEVSQLDQGATKIAIKLQGQQTSLTSLFFGHSKGLRELDALSIAEIIAGGPGLSVGHPLDAVVGPDASYQIERRNVVKSSILEEVSRSDTLTVVLSSMHDARCLLFPKKNESPASVPQYRDLHEFSLSLLHLDDTDKRETLVVGDYECSFVSLNEDNRSWRICVGARCWFILVSKDMDMMSVSALEQIHTDLSKNLLQLKDGELRWLKSSSGSLSFIRKHLDEERVSVTRPRTLIDDDARTLLIYSADVTNGKSLITQLAARTKSEFPRLWVLVLSFVDIIKLLSDDVHGQYNDLLAIISAVTETKEHFQKSLLRVAFECTGNVVVILNGFDHVETKCETRLFNFLTDLRQTKAKKIWILTASHILRTMLEDHLSVLATTLCEDRSC